MALNAQNYAGVILFMQMLLLFYENTFPCTCLCDMGKPLKILMRKTSLLQIGHRKSQDDVCFQAALSKNNAQSYNPLQSILGYIGSEAVEEKTI